MGKALFGVLAAVMAVLIGSTSTLEPSTVAECNYVDANGDGICDNCSTYHRHDLAGDRCGRYFVDMDGDGVCYYSDADGDGVCDYYETGHVRGCRRGHSYRGGCGR